MSQPTKEREAELIQEWHDLLLGAIEQLEDEVDVYLDDERAAVGMLAYLASQRRLT